MTPIRVSLSSLREGSWHEYVVRFVLGGGATVFAGIISSHFGAAIGGLFLALPAIFCASATLVERHEIRRKHQAGLAGQRRGQQAAAQDAAGAALGALGMLAFAAVFGWLVAAGHIVIAFIAASLAWIAVSIAAWYMRRAWRVTHRVRSGEASSRSAVSPGR
jgi:hypothetical protein